MATSFASVSLTPSQKSASWCFLLLEHLDEFAKLAWYLLADGKLVDDTFARAVAKLDMTAFESSLPALAYSQARNVLITHAITVLSDAERKMRTGFLNQIQLADRPITPVWHSC